MRLLFRLPVLSLLTLSLSAYAADEIERPQAGVMAPADQITQALDSSYQLLELDTGSDRFALLFRPAMTPNAKGNLLLIPDTGIADAWLEQSRALTAYLPEHGWNLLVVQPPDPPQPPLPARTLPSHQQTEPPATDTEAPPAAADGAQTADEGGTSDADVANDESPSVSFPDQINARLQTAWSELSQRGSGKQKLVLGIGSSATWGAQFVLAQGGNMDLIIFNPRPAPEAPDSLAELIIKLKQRQIVDLYHHPLPGYPDAEPDARQRRLLARRIGMSGYHQSRLPGVFRGWQGDTLWLARQVRGIMERVFWSEEVEAPETGVQPITEPPQPPGPRPQPQPARGPSAA